MLRILSARGFRVCRTRASAFAGRDAAREGAHDGNAEKNIKVNRSYNIHVPRPGLSPWALVFLLLLAPRLAFAAPSLEVDGNFAGYDDGEQYNGYVVVDSPDNYQSTLCLIGEYSKLPQITTEQYEKLSNPSTGGAFYELSQAWKKLGSNASGNEEYYPQWLALSEDFADGLVAVYGYGRVWAAVCTDDLKQQAKEDFNAILGGGDVGGDTGGSGGTVDGSNVKFTLKPYYANYVNCRRPSFTRGFKINGSIVEAIQEDGVGFAPNLEFDITFKQAIPIADPVIIAFIEPTYNGVSSMNLIICEQPDVTFNFNNLKLNDSPIVSGTPAYYETLSTEFIRTGKSVQYRYDFNNLSEQNTITNVSFSYYETTQSVKRTLGNGNPFTGYYLTDFENSGGVTDPEPSPDPWEPPTINPNPPTKPTPPNPKEPITPTPNPDPNPPTTPTPPTNPTTPVIADDDNFTVDLQGILDALNEHCIHIQTCLNSNFSNQNTFLGELFSVYTAAIVDQIYNGDVAKIEAIGNVSSTIADGVNDILEYWDSFTNWLDEKLDFQFPEQDVYDDENLLNWLRKIWARQGTGDVNTRPVDAAINYGGFSRWMGVLCGEIAGDVSDTSLVSLSSSLSSLQHTFPFSLPWDIQQVLSSLDVAPATPSATIIMPAVMADSETYEYEIDLHWMDGAMVAVRSFELMVFVLYCLVHTRDVFGYVIGSD